MVGIITTSILFVTLLAQALLPKRRLVLVLTGAALSVFVVLTTETATINDLYATIPWNVLVILVSLLLFTQVFVRSNVFGVISVRVAHASKGSEPALMLLFACAMFGLSCTLNNLTALLLCLPVMLTIMSSFVVSQRFVTVCLALVIVACNLGGAATPIGDFPAIVLLGTGAVSFNDYLVLALPTCVFTFAFVLAAFYLLVRRQSGAVGRSATSAVSLALLSEMFRRTRIKGAILVPAALVFLAMFALWVAAPESWHLPPDVVCFGGVSVLLLLSKSVGDTVAQRETDAEAILFFGALFLMVGAVSVCGVPNEIANRLLLLKEYPAALLILFLVAVSLLTAVFSAGPAMTACLPIAANLTSIYRPEGLYVAMAMSVCAGSSFLLTAATAGPLAQNIVERANMTVREGGSAKFTSGSYLSYGVLAWFMILIAAIIFAQLFAASRG